MQIEHTEFQDQLVRGLAHRMNNILTLFHGYIGLLLDNKELDAATIEGLAKIQEGARAATELMDRTHSLVRPSSVVWREVDLAEMLRRLRPTFEQMCAPEKTFEFHCTDNAPRIWADVGRVKTAVIEVVRNACEAASRKVRVDLTSGHSSGGPGQAEQPPQWVTVTVTDDGPGIPDEIMGKIFAPFFTMKKKRNAAGLGLTVALGFVQHHGGTVRVSSVPRATAVQIQLPARIEAA